MAAAGARRAWEERARERLARMGEATAERLAELGEIRDRILAGAAIRPGEQVADLGCGSGLLAFAAADAAGPGRVSGVDLNETALRATRDLAEGFGVGFVRADVRRLPCGDGAHDVVIWRSLLAYLDGRPEALTEARRILRPGGRISFSESVGRGLQVLFDDPVASRLWDGLKSILDGVLGDLAFSRESLEELATASGFTEVAIEVEPRRTMLTSPRAVEAFFDTPPPAGLSMAGIWRATGVPDGIVSTFLAAAAAAVPLTLETPEAYVTARSPA